MARTYTVDAARNLQDERTRQLRSEIGWPPDAPDPVAALRASLAKLDAARAAERRWLIALAVSALAMGVLLGFLIGGAMQ